MTALKRPTAKGEHHEQRQRPKPMRHTLLPVPSHLFNIKETHDDRIEHVLAGRVNLESGFAALSAKYPIAPTMGTGDRNPSFVVGLQQCQSQSLIVAESVRFGMYYTAEKLQCPSARSSIRFFVNTHCLHRPVSTSQRKIIHMGGLLMHKAFRTQSFLDVQLHFIPAKYGRRKASPLYLGELPDQTLLVRLFGRYCKSPIEFILVSERRGTGRGQWVVCRGFADCSRRSESEFTRGLYLEKRSICRIEECCVEARVSSRNDLHANLGCKVLIEKGKYL